MTDRTHDHNGWLETYKDAFNSFSKAQQDAFKTLERFARFHCAVAGDLLEVSLAQAKAALGVRAPVGTEALADLFQKQAELGTHFTEKLKERAQEFSALASEVQESVGKYATDTAHRTSGHRRAAA